MKTVHEVSKLTGVSIRALQYYDRIGLLKPAAYTEAGYRLYKVRRRSSKRALAKATARFRRKADGALL